MEMQTTGRRKPWGAFNIVTKGDKSYWNRIGTAYLNQDGSYNIYLECLPRDGKVQIREQTDRDVKPERGALAEEAAAEA
jgi:hypothetical protein